MMIARHDTITTKSRGIGGCYAIVLYDSGTSYEDDSDLLDQRFGGTQKQKPISERMQYLEGEATWDPSFDETLNLPEFEDESWYAAVAVDFKEDSKLGYRWGFYFSCSVQSSSGLLCEGDSLT